MTIKYNKDTHTLLTLTLTSECFYNKILNYCYKKTQIRVKYCIFFMTSFPLSVVILTNIQCAEMKKKINDMMYVNASTKVKSNFNLLK